MAIVMITGSMEELKLKCNETLEIISDWTKDHSLMLTQEKSKAVLITKRRKFDYFKLELKGHAIKFQDSIRYLGIFIDKSWNF